MIGSETHFAGIVRIVLPVTLLMTPIVEVTGAARPYRAASGGMPCREKHPYMRPQHFLYFFLLPQGQIWFLSRPLMTGA